MEKQSKKTRKVYNSNNFELRPVSKKYEKSVIVPDVNLSLTMILKKYTGGTYHGREPQFTDPELMDLKQGIDARKLSLCELHELKQENQEKIQKLQKQIQDEQRVVQLKQAEELQQKYRDDLRKEIQNEMAEETSNKH